MSKRPPLPSVVICASIFNCHDFQGEEDGAIGEKEKVSVVLAPIRVINAEARGRNEAAHLISWGCSRGQKCLNQGCRYAKRANDFVVVRT